MKNTACKVCVTGGSGYIASLLIKKLLETGHTVHATLRNLGDPSKVGLLMSLPHAETKLVLFQADIYNPTEFDQAIHGCEFVFHVATPMQHNTQSSLFKDKIEAAVAGVRSIADSCIRSKTVKRLIYTSSVTASSPLTKDGLSYKSCIDESCWTPFDVSFPCSTDHTLGYTRSKTLAEKEALSYNSIDNGKLEVVTLVCALVGGEGLLSYLSGSVEVILSPITQDLPNYNSLRFLEELLGSVPLVHVDDVCEAHIFCMEKASMRGRFLCVSSSPTIRDMANYYQRKYPEYSIPEEFMGGQERGHGCDCSKLIEMGFEYKYDTEKIIDNSVRWGRRLGALSTKFQPNLALAKRTEIN